jgi:membrane protease YdiL (CAAX protease family)
MSTPPDDDTSDEALDERTARNTVVGLAIAVEGGLIGLSWLLGWLLSCAPLARFAFDERSLLWGVAAALPMLAGFFAAVRWPVGPLGRIKDFTDRVIRPLMRRAYLGLLYELTGNLLTPIVAHALYDFVALVYLTRGPGSDLPPEPEPEPNKDEAEI